MEEINYKLCIHKLTPEEQNNIDPIGWFSVMIFSERERSYEFFKKMGEIPYRLKNSKLFDLFLLKTADGVEAGRFARTNNTITGLVVYKEYRGNGAINTVLEYIDSNYEFNDIYTSNKYLARKLSETSNYRISLISGDSVLEGFDLLFTSREKDE